MTRPWLGLRGPISQLRRPLRALAPRASRREGDEGEAHGSR